MTASGATSAKQRWDQRWNQLSPRTRRLLLVTGAIEGLLKIAALLDLVRRPGEQVRGPKWRWGLAITVLNSMGTVPLSYFAFGRRRTDAATGD